MPVGLANAVTPYPPSPFQSLMFYCQDPVSMGRLGQDTFELQPSAVLVGPQCSRVNIKVCMRLRAIRVDFVPGGLYRMLGVPMFELLDGGFDASEFFGPEMRSITERLKQGSSLEDCKNVVEKFLLAQVSKSKQSLPFDSAMLALLKQDGNMSMEDAAALSCLSLKQFERKCKERIGMNPKMYARILRFSKAYRLHEAVPNLSWIEIAYHAGYYDQMHMIRDFKNFAGVNPSVIELQLLATPIRMQKDFRY
jgi:AraC-like DNA-binding protein